MKLRKCFALPYTDFSVTTQYLSIDPKFNL